MKLFKWIIIFSVMSSVFISCGRVEEINKDYRLASDGLFYHSNSDMLYSGTITDTSNMILNYEVVDGRKNGMFKIFYPDGTLEQSGYISDNRYVGEWKYYHRNGNLESKGMFINDMPEGEWIYFYPDGMLKTQGCFKGGQRYGIWYEYEKTGEVKLIYVFRSDRLVEALNSRT